MPCSWLHGCRRRLMTSRKKWKQVEEEELKLSGEITIYKVEENCFRYGKNWNHPGRLNFSDIRKLITAVLSGEMTLAQKEIPKTISLHAHYRSVYYMSVLRLFMSKYSYTPVTGSRPAERNYVLI